MSRDALPLVAGSASTAIFVASYLPMVVKALRTKDLGSYSHANLMLANLGNAVHSVYVYSLPFGPIWALHSFYAVTGAFMHLWYVRCTSGARRLSSQRSTDECGPAAPSTRMTVRAHDEVKVQ